MNKTYLQFDCGARLPKTGFLLERHDKCAKENGARPRRDGRYRVIVFDTETNCDKPYMEKDGYFAPCLGGCPCKKSSGRKEERAMSEIGATHRILVLCYPKEMEEE